MLFFILFPPYFGEGRLRPDTIALKRILFIDRFIQKKRKNVAAGSHAGRHNKKYPSYLHGHWQESLPVPTIFSPGNAKNLLPYGKQVF
jgi:hypothetical protein